jgi:hypothetical protein
MTSISKQCSDPLIVRRPMVSILSAFYLQFVVLWSDKVLFRFALFVSTWAEAFEEDCEMSLRGGFARAELRPHLHFGVHLQLPHLLPSHFYLTLTVALRKAEYPVNRVGMHGDSNIQVM